MLWRLLFLPMAAALLAACGGDDDAQELTLPPGALAFEVCGDDPAWLRPSLEEQRAYVIADPRWRAFGTRNREQFEAHFWSVGHSASGAGTILEFSGMWNLPNEGKDFYWDALHRCFNDPSVNRDEYLPLWLFEHEVISAREEGETIEVAVRPRDAGVQIVALRRPGGIYDREMDVIFVDAAGGLLEKLDSLWSTPP